MRSRADKIEILDVFAAVVRAQPRRLKKRRLDGERAAEITVQIVLKMKRVNKGNFCPKPHKQSAVDSWQ